MVGALIAMIVLEGEGREDVAVTWIGAPSKEELTIAHAALTRDLLTRFRIKDEDREQFLQGLVRLVQGMEDN